MIKFPLTIIPCEDVEDAWQIRMKDLYQEKNAELHRLKSMIYNHKVGCIPSLTQVKRDRAIKVSEASFWMRIKITIAAWIVS